MCRGRALGDVEREARERPRLACGLHVPPDRGSAEIARRQRRLVARRALVTLEGGEYDAGVVRRVGVVEREAGEVQPSRDGGPETSGGTLGGDP